MNISKLYVLLEEDKTIARVYEWDTNHLTLEELLAYIASRNKMPKAKKWIENDNKS